ncbi:MAG: sigma 54-interacting transcriptional regulator [Elusimicrobiota bacterium]
MDGSFHDREATVEHVDEILPLPTLGMVGGSAELRAVRRAVLAFAALPVPVLVTGESGTGKELVARALHDHSPRRARPFVALNAAALPAALIASELFGHERGAFTGATHRHRGVFEQADGGTLFLDEVADLAPDLQAWLLRVLETGEVRPLGGERTRQVDARVIAATHVELEPAVAAGRFRADLYWRLVVLRVHVPPLRERPEDIVPMARHLLAGLPLDEPRRLDDGALQVLILHDWLGNVRELRAVLLRAAARAGTTTLTAADIVNAIGRRLAMPERPENDVQAALLATGGNVAKAARMLDVPRTTLRDRLRAGSGSGPVTH